MKTLSSEGVKSINGKSGTVVITNTDVGAPSLSEFTILKDIVDEITKVGLAPPQKNIEV